MWKSLKVLCLWAVWQVSFAINLGWDLPIDLADVAGYEIHYGYASEQYSVVVDVPGTTNNSISFDPGLGDWYFAVRSRNADATSFSTYSNEVFAQIVADSPLGLPVEVTQWNIGYAQQGDIGMAVEITGTGTLEQSQSDGSFSITIPSDADAVVVAAVGFPDDENNWGLDELNFDDGGTQDFTQIERNGWWAQDSDWQVAAFIMTTDSGDWPGTGSKSLYYSSVGIYEEGYQIYAFYVKNLDTADPIVDTDSSNGNQDNSWTSSLSGVGTGDMSFIVTYAYNNTPDVNPSGEGQTALIESAEYNLAGLGVGYEVGETDMTADAQEFCPIAFTLKESSGAAVTIPIMHHHYSKNLRR